MSNIELIQHDFDRIAGLEDEGWNHNNHYHDLLLQHVPANSRHALEIGCGKGEFSRRLAARVNHVEGIDLSPIMIQKATEQSADYPNIRYATGDIMNTPLEANKYDYIVSIAVFHHLELEELLPRLKDAVKPGGVIAILDLYEQSTMLEYLSNVRSFFTNVYLSLVKETKKRSKEETEAWKEHIKHDKYMRTKALRETYRRLLPGSEVRVHVLWRYSMIWRKP